MIDMRKSRLKSEMEFGRERVLTLWSEGHNYDGRGPADIGTHRPLYALRKERRARSHRFTAGNPLAVCGQQTRDQNDPRGKRCRNCLRRGVRFARFAPVTPGRVDT